jgi:hypothetical protein
MDPPDDDIEFDFFEDEPRTTEVQQPSRVRLPRRGGARRGSGMRRPAGPPRGMTPFLRLLAAVSILVAIFVIFGLLLESCAATSKHDEYSNYMGKVATIARASAADGNLVATDLTTAGLKISDLETKLSGVAVQEQQNLTEATHLNPPGPLRPEHQNLIDALQLRIYGTQGLADQLGATAASKSSGDASLLSAEADKLLASDVVWDDLFLAPAKKEMADRGVTGVQVPESHYVTNPDMVTTKSMGFVLDRLRGASTGGTPTGLHGTNLVSVAATPKGPTLSTSTDLNQIVASPDLGFDVVVHDGGNSQEVGIKVTLTIQRVPASGTPIVETKTISVIDPNQDVTVHFTKVNVGTLIAEKAKLTVDVATVRGEADKNNNTATYPVIFSLG